MSHYLVVYCHCLHYNKLAKPSMSHCLVVYWLPTFKDLPELSCGEVGWGAKLLAKRHVFHKQVCIIPAVINTRGSPAKYWLSLLKDRNEIVSHVLMQGCIMPVMVIITLVSLCHSYMTGDCCNILFSWNSPQYGASKLILRSAPPPPPPSICDAFCTRIIQLPISIRTQVCNSLENSCSDLIWPVAASYTGTNKTSVSKMVPTHSNVESL